ncbi:MAG: class I SAM-dependent methyltransferase [Planctomycetaceae bacterium]
MSEHDRQRWNDKYNNRAIPAHLHVDDWLVERMANSHPGRALDLACGLGHNAIWLKRQGWNVDALDISPVGLELAQRFADQQSGHVNWMCADLEEPFLETRPELKSAYDLIVVFRFLDRIHLPRLIPQLLKPGGKLIYETFTSGQLQRADNHLRDPNFLLQPGELPQLYSSLTVIEYEEVTLSDRCVARLDAELQGRN